MSRKKPSSPPPPPRTPRVIPAGFAKCNICGKTKPVTDMAVVGGACPRCRVCEPKVYETNRWTNPLGPTAVPEEQA